MGKVEFTSSGSWTCPAGVKQVTLFGCGGGGGAGGPFTGALAAFYRGAQGGGGAELETVVVPVTPGTTYNVVIGAGGAAGVVNANGTQYGGDGQDGGDTTFDDGVTTYLFQGGAGGLGGRTNATDTNILTVGMKSVFPLYGQRGQMDVSLGANPFTGQFYPQDTMYGTVWSGNANYATLGGGGGASYGNGGNGGATPSAGTGYGSGGGSGHQASTTSYPGQPGFLRISWDE